MMTTHLIRSGKVLFPRHGAEELIGQLVDFDVSKYKDLADAFSNLILEVLKNMQKQALPEAFTVGGDDDDD